MEEVFKYVWIIILAALYFNRWRKVLSEVRKVKDQYRSQEIYKHLPPRSRKWIKWHLIILFLWSLGKWQE